MSSEESVGLRAFMSKTKGIGGAIKKEPEDFIVEEITPDGTVLEVGKSHAFEDLPGDYIHFTLEKSNWDTMRAVNAVARACSVSHKRLKFAGTKDRRSVSAQRVSIWKVPKEKLETVRIKDITLRDFTMGSEPINLGTLSGNRFTVVIRDVDKGAEKTAKETVKQLDNRMPNFFGTQRFGLRLNNHIVGKHILRGEIKEAAMAFLCDTGNEPEEATKARSELRKTEDFKTAFESFPNYLGFEKSVLNHLIKTPTDFVGGLRVLPKKLRKMFVHAYQGYIFNLALSEYIEKDEIPDELPLVGYTTSADKVTKAILKAEEIKVDEFKVPPMPEMTMKGESRKTIIQFKEFEILDFNDKNRNLRVRFSLPPGSYATMLLRELMK